ncbi:MAG: Ig-like domain-containing protein [Oscillospiraceae bacterium]|nr:Ig-like domain-containing protein [Oscillospiraceae bacterium]
MKKLLSIVMLVCIVASMCSVSAWAVGMHGKPYDVNGVGFDTWADAKSYADTLLGDITVSFRGEVTFAEGGTHGVDQIFPTPGKVSFVGLDNTAVFKTTGSGIRCIYQPGGLSFSNLTHVDASTPYSYDRGFRYTEFVGNVSFTGVYFGANSGVRVEAQDGIFGNLQFNSCVFEGTSDEYGLWVAQGSATVNGCTFSGNRAIKACDEYAKGSPVNLSVQNSSFSLNNKAAVEADIYSNNHQINLGPGNSYNCNIINLENSAKNVTLQPNVLAITPESVQVVINNTIQLGINPAGLLSNDKPIPVLWVSSDSNVATVDANGLVTACAPGQTTITAYMDNTSLGSSCTVVVTEAGAAPPVINPNNPAPAAPVVEDIYYIPATDDNSNMALWSILALALLSTAFVTRKRKNEN